MRYNQSGPRLNTMEALTEIQWTKVVFVSFSTLGHQFVEFWELECFCAYINNKNHPLSESYYYRLPHICLFQRHMAAGKQSSSITLLYSRFCSITWSPDKPRCHRSFGRKNLPHDDCGSHTARIQYMYSTTLSSITTHTWQQSPNNILCSL